MGLVGIHIPDREMEKGVPFISFVIKTGEGAVFIKPLPLREADISLKEQAAGSEILYRVDYLRGGRKKFAAGILEAGKRPENFLELLTGNIRSGKARADPAGICGCLKAHLALCRLEKLAGDEIALIQQEDAGTGDCREADISYYREIIAYAGKVRDCLNTGVPDAGLPPFPERGVFMAGWFRKHRDIRGACQT